MLRPLGAIGVDGRVEGPEDVSSRHQLRHHRLGLTVEHERERADPVVGREAPAADEQRRARPHRQPLGQRVIELHVQLGPGSVRGADGLPRRGGAGGGRHQDEAWGSSRSSARARRGSSSRTSAIARSPARARPPPRAAAHSANHVSTLRGSAATTVSASASDCSGSSGDRTAADHLVDLGILVGVEAARIAQEVERARRLGLVSAPPTRSRSPLRRRPRCWPAGRRRARPRPPRRRPRAPRAGGLGRTLARQSRPLLLASRTASPRRNMC